jgi:hypothetical protein
MVAMICAIAAVILANVVPVPTRLRKKVLAVAIVVVNVFSSSFFSSFSS